MAKIRKYSIIQLMSVTHHHNYESCTWIWVNRNCVKSCSCKLIRAMSSAHVDFSLICNRSDWYTYLTAENKTWALTYSKYKMQTTSCFFFVFIVWISIFFYLFFSYFEYFQYNLHLQWTVLVCMCVFISVNVNFYYLCLCSINILYQNLLEKKAERKKDVHIKMFHFCLQTTWILCSNIK